MNAHPHESTGMRAATRRVGRSVVAAAGVLLVSLTAAVSAGAGTGSRDGSLYRDAVSSPKGVVVSLSPSASAKGVEVLRNGGNAIDAAAATVFALGVARPDMCGIGGGGFLIYRSADGATAALDFREAAPLALPDGSLEQAGMHQYPNDQNPDRHGIAAGHRTTAVPGTVSGMAAALQRYGTISLSDAVEPAEDLARDGVAVSVGLATSTFFEQERLSNYEETRRIYLGANGTPLAPFTTLKQPEYADSLDRIQESGLAGFYGAESKTVSDIVKDSDDAADAAKTNSVLLARWDLNSDRGFTPSADKGFLKRDDFSSYAAKWRKPLRGTYRGHHIIAMPPPTSGGIATLEILNLLEGFPLGSVGENNPDGWAGGWGQSSANHLHALAEAEKIAFADREVYVADPDFVSVPTKTLTSKPYADRRRLEIKGDQTQTYDPGDVAQAHTSHVSVIDGSGNAVAVTCSMGAAFGSGVVAPGTGFLLNNHDADFDIGEEVSVNDPEGGKRPRSSISPTIVVKDGRPVLVTGAAGATTIILGVVQNIVNTVDFGRDIAHAIDDERVVGAGIRLFGGDCPAGSTLEIENSRIDDAVVDDLWGRGHRLCTSADIQGCDTAPGCDGDYTYLPRVQSAAVDPDGNKLGASDPRNDDEPQGAATVP